MGFLQDGSVHLFFAPASHKSCQSEGRKDSGVGVFESNCGKADGNEQAMTWLMRGPPKGEMFSPTNFPNAADPPQARGSY